MILSKFLCKAYMIYLMSHNIMQDTLCILLKIDKLKIINY